MKTWQKLLLFSGIEVLLSLSYPYRFWEFNLDILRRIKDESDFSSLRQRVLKNVITFREVPSPGEINEEEVKEFVSFKFGDLKIIDKIGDEIVDWFNENFGTFSSEDFILLIRESMVPRNVALLIEDVARKLGLRMVKIKVVGSIISYQDLTPEERASASRGTMEVEEDLSGKKVIIIDDVISSGSALTECVRAALEKGAREEDIIPVAYWNAKGNYLFESEAMEYFAIHPEIIELNNCELTQSFLKFLLRLVDEPQKVSKVLGELNEEKILELVSKFSLGFRTEIFSSDALEEFKKIFFEIVNDFWPQINAGGEGTLLTLKRIKEALPLRDNISEGTLYLPLCEWPSPGSLLLWAYIMNYDYLVLKDRRELSSSQIEEIMQIAQALKLSCTSPYFTTLPREVYSPEEVTLSQEIFSLLPQLQGFKEELDGLRREVNQRFEGLADLVPEASFQISQQYSERLLGIVREIIQLVWEEFKSEFPRLRKEDLGILVGGSTGRNEANPLSDLDMDIIVRNDDKKEEVLQFSRRIIQALRSVGILGTPLDVFLENLESGRYLFNLEDPFPERLSISEKVSTLMRVLSDRCIWGNEKLFRRFLAESKVEEGISVLLPNLKEIIENYIEIAKTGYGRIGYRDFRVWWDKERNLIYDFQGGIRFFQQGIYYLILADSISNLHNFPLDIPSAIDFIFDNNLVNEDIWNREEIKSGYIEILELRHRKASEAGSLYAPYALEDIQTLQQRLNILMEFMLENLP